MTTPSSRSGHPLIAYLDMNVWVEMARGCHTDNPRWATVVDALGAAVSDGKVVLPLSSSHYLELWNRSDLESRTRVATVMRDLSSYSTLAPIQDICRREIDVVVGRHAGIDLAGVTVEDLLGHGVNHAFKSPYGRFRFVESLASSDGSVAEGPLVAAPDLWGGVGREGPAWEWINLVGLDDVLRSAGLERTPTHRLGNVYLQEELRLRELVKREPRARARLEDLVVTDELKALTDTINQSCLDGRVDPYGLFLENHAHADPPAAMRAFVRSLPSVDTAVRLRLRLRKHQDLGHPRLRSHIAMSS